MRRLALLRILIVVFSATSTTAFASSCGALGTVLKS